MSSDELRAELEKRFDADNALIDAVIEQAEKAQTMEVLEDLHWHDPAGIADDIQSFSRGYGLKAGWNTWIGIQRTESSHLTL